MCEILTCASASKCLNYYKIISNWSGDSSAIMRKQSYSDYYETSHLFNQVSNVGIIAQFYFLIPVLHIKHSFVEMTWK